MKRISNKKNVRTFKIGFPHPVEGVLIRLNAKSLMMHFYWIGSWRLGDEGCGGNEVGTWLLVKQPGEKSDFD